MPHGRPRCHSDRLTHVCERVSLPRQVLDQWCEAPEAVLVEIFDGLRAEHGSVEGYLDSIGIDAELRARLKETLTVEAASL